VSGADEPEIVVPPGLESGVFANVVNIYEDIEYVTLDFVRIDPRDSLVGFVVARVNAPVSCILDLKQRIEHIT
jgi:hypothetical protein